MFEKYFNSVGKEDPGVGLTLVGTSLVKEYLYKVETHR